MRSERGNSLTRIAVKWYRCLVEYGILTQSSAPKRLIDSVNELHCIDSVDFAFQYLVAVAPLNLVAILNRARCRGCSFIEQFQNVEGNEGEA
jgi:hypothetical protein